MRYIKSILEYKKAAILPKELRHMNLLYHSTELENLDNILKIDKLYGTEMYDFGISTSRNKHYAFGRDVDGDYQVGHNMGDIQFILDRDKIKTKYKVRPFDWEEMKLGEVEIGTHSDNVQSEDKILANSISEFSKYVIGIHIVHNRLISELLSNNELLSSIEENSWFVFDENWQDITSDFNHQFSTSS